MALLISILLGSPNPVFTEGETVRILITYEL